MSGIKKIFLFFILIQLITSKVPQPEVTGEYLIELVKDNNYTFFDPEGIFNNTELSTKINNFEENIYSDIELKVYYFAIEDEGVNDTTIENFVSNYSEYEINKTNTKELIIFNTENSWNLVLGKKIREFKTEKLIDSLIYFAISSMGNETTTCVNFLNYNASLSNLLICPENTTKNETDPDPEPEDDDEDEDLAKNMLSAIAISFACFIVVVGILLTIAYLRKKKSEDDKVRANIEEQIVDKGNAENNYPPAAPEQNSEE